MPAASGDEVLRLRSGRQTSDPTFLEHAARDLEGVEAGRDAAIDRDLQEDLLDLLLGEAVVQRTVDVQLELGAAVQRCTTASPRRRSRRSRSEEHTSELQSHSDLVCRLLLEKKKTEESH